MFAYIVRRLLLIPPTLLGILVINFVIIQFAPGGPVEQMIAQITGTGIDATQRISGGGGETMQTQTRAPTIGGESVTSKYRGAQGLDPEFVKQLEKMFGFDKPAYERFFLMLKNYLLFDFGKSYFRDVSVLQLIKEKLPVSISLGL